MPTSNELAKQAAVLLSAGIALDLKSLVFFIPVEKELCEIAHDNLT